MSIIGDFFDKIRNRNRPALTSSQEARGQFTTEQIIGVMQQNGGMEEFFEELDNYFYKVLEILETKLNYNKERVSGLYFMTLVELMIENLKNMEHMEKKKLSKKDC